MNTRTTTGHGEGHAPGLPSTVAGARQAFLDFIDARHKAYFAGPGAATPTVVWVVLNHWQTFRDRLGFRRFDQLVDVLLERFRSRIAPEDRAERFGEATIAILLGPEATPGDVSGWAEDVLDDLSRQIPEVDGTPVAASVSMGLSPLSRHLRTPGETLLDAAQVAERLSREGRSQYEVFVPRISASQALEDENLLVELLRESLKENRIRVMFQPILGVDDDAARYFQVWARPVSRDGELIPAASFLRLTDRSRTVSRLELWVLAYAIRFLFGRRERLDAIRLFAPITPGLLTGSMLDWFAERLGQAPDVAGALVLEFALEGLDRTDASFSEMLSRLTGLGVRICLSGLDETSFSLPQLFSLPADYLRMSEAFTNRYCQDEDLARRFVEFIAEVHASGRQLIMPGVGDEQTMIRLWKINVDLIQGDFIQPPQEGSSLMRDL